MKLNKETRVGILFVAALVGLVWGLNYLKGTDLFTSANKYFAVYDDVQGLVESNPVMLNGYKIGQVDKIGYLPDHSGRMVLTLYVHSSVFMPKSATANIVTSDILGTKAVEIVYGEDRTPANNKDTIAGAIKKSIGDEIRPFKDKAENLVGSLDSLAKVLTMLLNPDSRGSLQKALKNFEHASGSIDNLVSDQNSKLRMMLSNAEQISLNLKNNSEKLNTIFKNFAQISDSLAKINFATTMTNANSVLIETKQIMTKINKGEGTLGLLINNDSLYHNLSRTSDDLDKLLVDLKANPKRYVHFSMFGKSAK